MHRSIRTRPSRRLLLPATLPLLFLLVALAPLGGALLATTVILLVLLAAVVVVHYRLEGRRRHSGRETRRPLLASPIQVAVALLVVIVIGSFAAITLALLTSVVGGFGGNGRTLLRLLLAVFALAPCCSIGSRCGRWWAFSGSILLAPAGIVCALVAGLGFSQAALDVIFVVAATALVAAAGSLHSQLGSPRHSRRSVRQRPNREQSASGTAATPDLAAVSRS